MRSLPVDGVDDRAVAERDAVALADLVGRGAVLARQPPVEGALQTRQGTHAVERVGRAEEADQVGPDVVGGVLPDGVAAGVEPLEARRPGAVDHGGGQRGGHPAGEVLEAALRRAEPVESVEVVELQLVGQESGQLGCPVAGQLRVGDQHQPVDRLGQRLAVAVEDVAACGGQHDLDRALGGGHLGVGVGVQALQLDETGAEHRQHHRDDDEADAEPQLGRAAADPCRRGRTTRSRRHDSSSAGSRISGRHGWSSRGPACSH